MYNGNVKQLFTLYALVMRNLSNDVTKPLYSYFHIIGIHEVHEKVCGFFSFSSSSDLVRYRGYFSTIAMAENDNKGDNPQSVFQNENI